MNALAALAAALRFFGRHGTLVAALSIFIGLLLPGLPPLFKPTLGTVIVLMLVLAFLRVDPAELRRHFTRPALIAAAVIWVMLVTPALLGGLFLATGLARALPGAYFMLVLQVSAPSLMSGPAIAAMLGLDVALSLATLIATVAVGPLTVTLFSHFYLGTTLLSPLVLGERLFLIIGGSALAAAVIRKLAGRRFIEAQHDCIDGLSVVLFVIFAIAAMDGVTAHFRTDPILVTGLTVLAFALCLGIALATALVFLPLGRDHAFAIALMACYRNMGIILTATGFAVPEMAWLYFAVAQFPIYILPQVMRPLVRRLTKPTASGNG